MKKKLSLIFSFLLLGSLSLVAQKKETRKVSSFSEISIGGSFDVILLQDNKEQVIIEAKESDIKKIATEVIGDRLKIYIPKTYRNWYRNNIDAKLYIHFKTLESIASSGSSEIYGQGKIDADELDVSCSGSGSITLHIDAEKLSVSLSGSGDVELSGETNENHIRISGSTDLNALKLATKKTYIAISGSGDADVNVSEELEVKVSGSGDIRYAGNPERQKIKVSGSGDVRSIN